MSAQIHRLPVLVISAHNRCNCRCAMCDIWRNDEAKSFTAADLDRQLHDIGNLGVEWVVFTGGEALMNADIFAMARTLRRSGIRVTLLTSGLLLARYAQNVAADIDDVIVSLDGPRGIHDRIRRVIGAFDQLSAGVRALRAAAPEYPIAARCTVQKANHSALLDTAHAANSLGLASISFLAVDAGSTAFNHQLATLDKRTRNLLLSRAEIEVLEEEVHRLIAHPLYAMVAEKPEKLHRLVAYFRALATGSEPAAPRCNAPWVSTVVEHDGAVRPCFFHPPFGRLGVQSLFQVLNSDHARAFRDSLDVATNPICRRCVCSLYRSELMESEATA